MVLNLYKILDLYKKPRICYCPFMLPYLEHPFQARQKPFVKHVNHYAQEQKIFQSVECFPLSDYTKKYMLFPVGMYKSLDRCSKIKIGFLVSRDLKWPFVKLDNRDDVESHKQWLCMAYKTY